LVGGFRQFIRQRWLSLLSFFAVVPSHLPSEPLRGLLQFIETPQVNHSIGRRFSLLTAPETKRLYQNFSRRFYADVIRAVYGCML
jgi:hypothetical protein